MTTATIHHPCPKVGEPFELGLDGDYKNNQPLELVRRTSYDQRGWAHNGPLVEGRAIRSFKLIEIRPILTFSEVRIELCKYGKIPEGQWVIGFKTIFSVSDGKGPIGIADGSWVAPDGHLNFLCIGRGGDLRFHRASGSFGPVWRWIVELVEAPFGK